MTFGNECPVCGSLTDYNEEEDIEVCPKCGWEEGE